MGVRVDEAGRDRHAADVAGDGAVRDGEGAVRSHRGDAVAVYEDIAPGEDLVAAHGDDAGAAQEEVAGGEVAGCVEIDPDLGGAVAGGVVRGVRVVGGLFGVVRLVGAGRIRAGARIRRVRLSGLGCLDAVRKRTRCLQVVAEVRVAERPGPRCSRRCSRRGTRRRTPSGGSPAPPRRMDSVPRSSAPRRLPGAPLPRTGRSPHGRAPDRPRAPS